MNITDKNKIGDLVARDYRTSIVFKRHGIDFCCHGNRTIAEALLNEEINSTVLLDELNQAVNAQEGTQANFEGWPLDLLADYVEKIHHRYVESQLPVIKEFIDKIIHVHGVNNPELTEIRNQFEASSSELLTHMKREEEILFPKIRCMINPDGIKNHHSDLSEFSVKALVGGMMDEHIIEGERFKKIRKLSREYEVPKDGCQTYATTFFLLDDFENDLHRHIHIENNILFPRAVELEHKMAGDNK